MQVVTSLLASCNNFLQQADIRMCLYGLQQLVDDKSVASCQQTCCKLVNLTGLLQIVSASCNKSANDIATSLILTDFCNLTKLTSLLQLVDKLKQAGKIDNLQQV